MRYRFLLLFISLLAMILVVPVLHQPGGSVFLANMLVTAICAAGARVLFAESRRRTLKMLIAAPPAIGAWLGYLSPALVTNAMIVVAHASAMAFFLLMLVVVLRSVYREPKITMDGVFAAMCGYILLGLSFGQAYDTLETLCPGALRMDDTVTRGNQQLVLMYFSFITLATVGYGDVLPVSPLARSLAMVEAIVGQFYIAVLVADLIGKRISQSMEPAAPPRP